VTDEKRAAEDIRSRWQKGL